MSCVLQIHPKFELSFVSLAYLLSRVVNTGFLGSFGGIRKLFNSYDLRRELETMKKDK